MSGRGANARLCEREKGARLVEKLGDSILVPWPKTRRQGRAALILRLAEERRTALGVRGVLHGPDALLDRLKSCSEHGGGQVGYALAIAESGFDPFLDQPLL